MVAGTRRRWHLWCRRVALLPHPRRSLRLGQTWVIALLAACLSLWLAKWRPTFVLVTLLAWPVFFWVSTDLDFVALGEALRESARLRGGMRWKRSERNLMLAVRLASLAAWCLTVAPLVLLLVRPSATPDLGAILVCAGLLSVVAATVVLAAARRARLRR